MENSFEGGMDRIDIGVRKREESWKSEPSGLATA